MIICLLIPLGAASASDINTTTADDQVLSATPQVDTLSTGVNLENENDTLSVQSDENILGAGVDDSGNNILGADEYTGTFDDIRSLIKISKDKLDLNINYIRSTSDTKTIELSKSNFILDGHGNTIDINQGTNNIFVVSGNNVTIKNLIIKNSNGGWPIWLSGADDKVDNVTIINTLAAIYCNGENALINNSKFIKTTYGGSAGTGGAFPVRVDDTDLSIYNSEFINCSSCIGSTDSSPCESILIDNVNFTNCKNTMENWAILVFPSYGQLTLKNSRIINCTGVDGVIGSYYTPMVISNCVFENNTQNMRSVRAISGGIILDRCGGSDISYCNFSNNKVNSGATIVAGASTIDHCTFTNNTQTSSVNYVLNPLTSWLANGNAIFSDAGNTVISNCVFRDNNNTGVPLFGYAQTADLSGFTIKDCSIFNNNVSCIIGDFDSSSAYYPDMYDLSNVSMYGNYFNNGMFSFKKDTHVLYPGNATLAHDNSNTQSTFDGIDNSTYLKSYDLYDVVYANPDNITEGLSKVRAGGILYLDSGVYKTDTVVEQGVAFAFSKPIKVIGKRDSTIFESNVFAFYAPKLELHNFTVRNSLICSTDSPYAVFNNITIVNNTGGNYIRTYHGFGVNYTNIIIRNASGGASYYWQSVASKLTFSNITFEDCPKVNVNFYSGSGNQAKASVLNNITVKNCNLSGFNMGVSNGEINNITLSNLKLTSGVYSLGSSTTKVFNLTVDNITGSSSAILSNLHSLDLAHISNINATNALISNPSSAIDWNNIYISDVNASSMFLNKLVGVVDGLNLIDSNFTSNVIFSGGDNLRLNNLIFEDFGGHIVIDGDKVNLLKSKFTRANNLDLNGSCILVKTGSDNFNIVNTQFISNVGGNGTVYIEAKAQRSSFNNCTFTDNTATKGGALYLVSTLLEKAIVVIDQKTNNTILYPGKPGYIDVGYNDLDGYIADFYDELYFVNDTSNWYAENAHDGHSRETATNNLALVYNLIDGGKVYFVRPGDVFTSDASRQVTSTFSNVTFYGNSTTLVNYGIVIDSAGENMKIHNITFKNYGSTGLIINATGCLIDNCSFVNVGGANVKYGGAIQVNANNTIINNSHFTKASASSSNGVGGAIYINATDITVENCDFKQNTASDSGSHIYINEIVNNVNLIGNNFTSGNGISGVGSSVYVSGGTNIVITNNNFTNNTGRYGAALYVTGDISLVNIAENNFTNNTANYDGGALFIIFNNGLKQNIDINFNTFFNNTAKNDGGALYVSTCDLFGVSMNGNNYINNTAEADGGAVYINNPGYVLSNALVENNTANNYGGGVYVNAKDVTIRDVDFVRNNATYGGALAVNALNTQVINSDFYYNTANVYESKGSAVFVTGNGGVTLTNVELNNNYVFGENTSFQRGDIYVDGGKFGDNGIVYGDSPYKQYLSNESVLTLNVAYVSQIGGGSGITPESPTTLTGVMSLLEANSLIYIVGDEDLSVAAYSLNNLNNVTIVNYNDGRNRKIKLSENEKYLFIHLNQIK